MSDIDFLRPNTVTPQGRVASHDVTRYGLHRICIEQGVSRPDADLWIGIIPDGFEVLANYVDEKLVGNQHLFSLWIFCKPAKGDDHV